MMNDEKDVVVILSGGLDSTTVLYKLLDEGKNPIALTFNYGQKATKEINCAKEICEEKGVEHHVFDISSILDLLNASSLIDKDNNNLEEPENTVVPSRNTILLSLATAFAISNDRKAVYYGAHKGDENDYPDCTPEFLNQMNELNKVNNYDYIPIYAPFIHVEKSEVVKEAIRIGVPIEKTWSCYVNEEEPCGVCFSCVTRQNAIDTALKELGMDHL